VRRGLRARALLTSSSFSFSWFRKTSSSSFSSFKKKT